MSWKTIELIRADISCYFNRFMNLLKGSKDNFFISFHCLVEITVYKFVLRQN